MIKENYTVKPGSIGKPKVYLRSDIGKVSYPYGSHRLTLSSDSNVKEVVKNVKTKLQRDGFKFNRNLSGTNYSPQNTF